MGKLIKIFGSDDMLRASRLAILDTFLIIAKQITLRPVFLRENTLQMMMGVALKVIKE